ncbi:hypothetical protein HMPREF0216_01505 [Clostridium celatum DSM 1785]|uniref:Uncharacterized protein n=1 Tax=Clostridium celatum DSM 1785 TaxID=545697 RepID=L1QH00_9CLOT|nr:hypothetical protein HMPREF0216_01505 [Clostridium celatum DSM 1785]
MFLVNFSINITFLFFSKTRIISNSYCAIFIFYSILNTLSIVFAYFQAILHNKYYL